MRGEGLVFIIIPVYNDAATIRAVVAELQQTGYKNIVVVDDGSSQPVKREVDGLPVHYLRHEVNLGQGAAIQTGFNFALDQGASSLVTFDADGQHDPADLQTLLAQLGNGEADVILGSRFLGKSQEGISVTKRVVLQGGRMVNFFFSGLYLSDAHNGLRIFNRKAASLLNLTENRMAHASEILFRIREKKLVHREVAVNIRYTPYSLTKGQSGWNSIVILLDIMIYKIAKWRIWKQ